MGKFGRKIIELDIKKLVDQLNKAFASEWLAFYQYWIGAKIATGLMKDAVIKELEQHATEELNHAQMLSARIIQLGEKPLLSPQDWFKMSTCDYLIPSNPQVKKILEQNIKGEQCAITTYNNFLKLTKDKDPVTYNIILQILTNEIEHEEDLEALLEDLKNK